MIRLKATWLPHKMLLVKQLAVSTASFITLPLFRPVPNGIQKFFYNNYYKAPDGLIFDGTTSGYYAKINNLIDINVLDKCVVIDIGCGNGSLYQWLKRNSISFEKYIGIDFAASPEIADDHAEFILDDASTYNAYCDKYLNRAFFMVNTICYLQSKELERLFQSQRANDKLIIIEPSPNIFWDAHFKGVKPIYRRIIETEKILKENGFEIINEVQDYAIKKKNTYSFPLSYGIYARKLR